MVSEIASALLQYRGRKGNVVCRSAVQKSKESHLLNVDGGVGTHHGVDSARRLGNLWHEN